MNELISVDKVTASEIFTNNGAGAIVARITKEAKSIVTDISTAAGRKEIASIAYKIARSKTLLDDLGKDLVSQWKEQSKKVDAERKKIRDALDALKDEVRKPLDDWEAAEAARVKNHQDAVAEIENGTRFDAQQPASSEIVARIETLQEKYAARQWQEFADRAADTVRTAVAKLEFMAATAIKAEEERAELDRLRAEAVERQQRERDEAMKAEAAAKAKAEAELAAKREAEAKAAEHEREVQRLAKAKAEAEAREQQAERDRVAAIEKAAKDAEEAVARERQRVEAERAAAAAEAARREADEHHRGAVNDTAAAELVEFANLTGTQAVAVVAVVAAGRISRMSIAY